MKKGLKRYTQEEQKFAEDIFNIIQKSFDDSVKEDEEIKNRWTRHQ